MEIYRIFLPFILNSILDCYDFKQEMTITKKAKGTILWRTLKTIRKNDYVEDGNYAE